MENMMYEYKAIVLNVVDGDTIDVSIDLGFFVNKVERVRLSRINAFETKLGKTTTAEDKKKGLEGKEFLTALITGKRITLQSLKPNDFEKYGRFLAEVVVDEKNVNDLMVEKGFAVTATY
jgi:micrococcal nuclease